MNNVFVISLAFKWIEILQYQIFSVMHYATPSQPFNIE